MSIRPFVIPAVLTALLAGLTACGPASDPADEAVLDEVGQVSGSEDTDEVKADGVAATGTWAKLKPLPTAVSYFRATALKDGRVLVSGGEAGAGVPQKASWLLDPARNTWTSTTAMKVARTDHASVLLADGRVLVAGGMAGNGEPQKTAEIYDPARKTWTATGALHEPRQHLDLIALADGRVLALAGLHGAESEKTNENAEVFDPAKGTWSAAIPYMNPRQYHRSIALADGKVMILGGSAFGFGSGEPLATTELFDPATNKFVAGPSLPFAFDQFGVTRTTDGKLYAAGGNLTASDGAARLVSYDPAARAWTAGPHPKTLRINPVVQALANGQVLVCGGASNLQTCGRYKPAAKKWVNDASMPVSSAIGATTVLLPSGKVVILGVELTSTSLPNGAIRFTPAAG